MSLQSAYNCDGPDEPDFGIIAPMLFHNKIQST